MRKFNPKHLPLVVVAVIVIVMTPCFNIILHARPWFSIKFCAIKTYNMRDIKHLCFFAYYSKKRTPSSNSFAGVFNSSAYLIPNNIIHLLILTISVSNSLL